MSARTQAKVLRVLESGDVEPVGAEQDDPRQRARGRRHPSRPRGGDPGRPLPRGPLLPPRRWCPCARPPCASTSRTCRCWSSTSCAASASRTTTAPSKITPEAMDLLRAQPWKGNVRELRNLVERLLILSPGEAIDAAAVAAMVGAGQAGARPGLPRAQDPARVPRPGREAVPDPEARRAPLERDPDRDRHRHAAQQPVQEDGAVRDPTQGGGQCRRVSGCRRCWSGAAPCAAGTSCSPRGCIPPAYVQCALLLEEPRRAREVGVALAAELAVTAAGFGAGARARRRRHRPRGGRGARGAVPIRRARRAERWRCAGASRSPPASGWWWSRTSSPPASRRSRPPRWREAAGARVVGIGSIIDRSGGRHGFQVPYAGLLTLDLPTFAPESCPLCAEGDVAVKPGSRPGPRPDGA